MMNLLTGYDMCLIAYSISSIYMFHQIAYYEEFYFLQYSYFWYGSRCTFKSLARVMSCVKGSVISYPIFLLIHKLLLLFIQCVTLNSFFFKQQVVGKQNMDDTIFLLSSASVQLYLTSYQKNSFYLSIQFSSFYMYCIYYL